MTTTTNPVVTFMDGISGFVNEIATRIPILQFVLNLVPLLIIGSFFFMIIVIILKWLGVEDKFFSNLLTQPTILIPLVIFVIVLLLLAQAGGLDVMLGRTNYTGPMGVPTEDITQEDLANPGILLTQPQIAGTLMLFAVFAVVTYMISQKK